MLGRVMRRSARLAAACRPLATMSMTADADRLLSVQNYYGEVLKSSKDLKVLPAGISIRDPFFVAPVALALSLSSPPGAITPSNLDVA